MVTAVLAHAVKTALVGGVAQLVEHLLCKQGVVGSSPFASTNLTSFAAFEAYALYASFAVAVSGLVSRQYHE